MQFVPLSSLHVVGAIGLIVVAVIIGFVVFGAERSDPGPTQDEIRLRLMVEHADLAYHLFWLGPEAHLDDFVVARLVQIEGTNLARVELTGVALDLDDEPQQRLRGALRRSLDPDADRAPLNLMCRSTTAPAEPDEVAA